jgi:hypothetical protein
MISAALFALGELAELTRGDFERARCSGALRME